MIISNDSDKTLSTWQLCSCAKSIDIEYKLSLTKHTMNRQHHWAIIILQSVWYQIISVSLIPYDGRQLAALTHASPSPICCMLACNVESHWSWDACWFFLTLSCKSIWEVISMWKAMHNQIKHWQNWQPPHRNAPLASSWSVHNSHQDNSHLTPFALSHEHQVLGSSCWPTFTLPPWHWLMPSLGSTPHACAPWVEAHCRQWDKNRNGMNWNANSDIASEVANFWNHLWTLANCMQIEPIWHCWGGGADTWFQLGCFQKISMLEWQAKWNIKRWENKVVDCGRVLHEAQLMMPFVWCQSCGTFCGSLRLFIVPSFLWCILLQLCMQHNICVFSGTAQTEWVPCQHQTHVVWHSWCIMQGPWSWSREMTCDFSMFKFFNFQILGHAKSWRGKLVRKWNLIAEQQNSTGTESVWSFQFSLIEKLSLAWKLHMQWRMSCVKGMKLFSTAVHQIWWENFLNQDVAASWKNNCVTPGSLVHVLFHQSFAIWNMHGKLEMTCTKMILWCHMIALSLGRSALQASMSCRILAKQTKPWVDVPMLAKTGC